jgi:hypothetical protein
VECVTTGARPLTDAVNGLEVVRVLEAADQSLREGGRPVEIDWDEVLDESRAAREAVTSAGGAR